jgi:hypothetical protein
MAVAVSRFDATPSRKGARSRFEQHHVSESSGAV